MATLVIDPSSLTPPGVDTEPVLHGGLKIRTSDDVLDQVAEQLELVASEGRSGFWLASTYERRLDGEPTYPDPGHGHQRLWIPAGVLLHLYYDRPLSADPDRPEERADTVYL